MQKSLLISATSVLTLDQITKYLVVFYMNLIERGQISVWPGFIHFHMAWNSGINFGLFSDNGLATRWILIAPALSSLATTPSAAAEPLPLRAVYPEYPAYPPPPTMA